MSTHGWTGEQHGPFIEPDEPILETAEAAGNYQLVATPRAGGEPNQALAARWIAGEFLKLDTTGSVYQ